MKTNIQKMIVALCLCLGAATVVYASGGVYDYNSGTASSNSNSSTRAFLNPNQKYIHYDLRVSVRTKNDAPNQMSAENRTYYKINVDLNQGAGGRWIYLYYATTTNASDALAGIFRVRGLGDAVWEQLGGTPSYFRVARSFANGNWTDLNQGAGGNYIFLAGGTTYNVIHYGYVDNTFPPYPGVEANLKRIVSIDVKSFDSAQSSYPGWILFPEDLNAGCKKKGRKYIYIIYKTD